ALQRDSVARRFSVASGARQKHRLGFLLPAFVPGGPRRLARAAAQTIEQLLIDGERLEEIEQYVGQLNGRRKEQTVVAVTYALGKARAVIERAHGHAGAKQIGHFHRYVEARRRAVKAQPEIGAGDDARIIFGFEPPGAKLNPACRQTRETPLEFRAARAVAGDQNDEVGEPPAANRGFPAANPLFEPHHRLDRDVEIFVFGPARRTDDEADASAADAEPSEEGLPEPLTLGAVDRREHRRRTVVKDAGVGDSESRLEKRGESARHAQVPVDAAGVATLVPASEPDRRMPLAKAQAQEREPDIVPVDDKPHVLASQGEPRGDQRRK